MIKKNGGVDIIWVTETEINNSHFNIQLSQDQLSFETIKTIKTKAIDGNCAEPLFYNYTDNNPPLGYSFYRIAQVDMDSNISYSYVTRIYWAESEQTVTVYPNPVHNNLKLKIELKENAIVLVEIIDTKGSIAYRSKQQTPSGFNLFNIPTTALANGIYLLRVKENGNMLSQQKFEKAG